MSDPTVMLNWDNSPKIIETYCSSRKLNEWKLASKKVSTSTKEAPSRIVCYTT